MAATDKDLALIAGLTPAASYRWMHSASTGLSIDEANERLRRFGPNIVSQERRATLIEEIWGRLRNPLNGLLLTLAIVSYFLGDLRAAMVIVVMVALAVATAFVQEHRSNQAAAHLRAMVHTRASVRRTPSRNGNSFEDVPLESLVPGDIVRLSAGDMIPRTYDCSRRRTCSSINQPSPAKLCQRRSSQTPDRPSERTHSTYPVSGSQCCFGVWHRCYHSNRRGNFPWSACGRFGRQTGADRVRSRRGAVHLDDDKLHPGDGAGSPPYRRPYQA